MRRVGLAQLMTMIAVMAIGLASMKNSTETTFRIGFGLSLLILLLGTLTVVVRRQGRATLTGFCLFGWSAFLTAVAPPMSDAIVPFLPIHKPLDMLVEWINPPFPQPTFPFAFTVKELEPFETTGTSFKMVPTPNSSLPFEDTPAGQQLNPQELASYQIYRSQSSLYENRRLIRLNSAKIGHELLGFCFACFGAVCGYFLDDRDQGAIGTSDPRSST